MTTRTTSPRDRFVAIFLKGGADGLSMCIPYREKAYRRLRPTTALPSPDHGGSIDLDGTFALPRALAALEPLFRDGRLAIVPACGLPIADRSHFNAQAVLDAGTGATSELATGWIARHLASTPPQEEGSIRALSMNAFVPRSLRGADRVAAMPSPECRASLQRLAESPPLRRVLESLYRGDPSWSAARDAMEALIAIDPKTLPGVPTEPESTARREWRLALERTGHVACARPDIDVLTVELDTWDTHVQQGAIGGALETKLRTLGDGLAELVALTDPLPRPTTIAVFTEFGRRVAENGNGGTDHGRGGVAMFIGRGIAGGRVIHRWPGLRPRALEDGRDVRITIDLRDLLAEVLEKRLGNPAAQQAFPEHDLEVLGLTRS